MKSPDDPPRDLRFLLLDLAMRWRQAVFLRELKVKAAARSEPRPNVDVGVQLFGVEDAPRQPCLQCRRDVLAKVDPAAPELKRALPRYHPTECSYLRALLLDLANLLSRDPALLAEWHRRAVERYGT
jgi:hypothetical protein